MLKPRQKVNLKGKFKFVYNEAAMHGERKVGSVECGMGQHAGGKRSEVDMLK